MAKRLIEIGHSPDPDDAFMFYALSSGLIDTGDLEIKDILVDIQTLNEWAKTGKLEVTALSVYGYAHVSDRYILLPYGSSVGRKYGPMIVAKTDIPIDELKNKHIAVPGELTTAFLTLKIMLRDFRYTVVPFQEIMKEVQEGKYDAGLIIHEGQLTYPKFGLQKIIDLGQWWFDQYGLPLPLGVNTIRKDLGITLMQKIGILLKQSIDYAMVHRQDAMTYAMKYADSIDFQAADRFVGMYVNADSMELNDPTRNGIQLLFRNGIELGLLPASAKMDVISIPD